MKVSKQQFVGMTYDELLDETVALGERCAKLEALVSDLSWIARGVGTNCRRHCPHFPACVEGDSLEHVTPCVVAEKARELGIDGWK